MTQASVGQHDEHNECESHKSGPIQRSEMEQDFRCTERSPRYIDYRVPLRKGRRSSANERNRLRSLRHVDHRVPLSEVRGSSAYGRSRSRSPRHASQRYISRRHNLHCPTQCYSTHVLPDNCCGFISVSLPDIVCLFFRPATLAGWPALMAGLDQPCWQVTVAPIYRDRVSE